MDESKYLLPAEEARHYMIAPPLRKKKNQEVLWQALKEGRIQTIATDHCSFTKEQKMMGAEDFSKTPCGMPGAEERPALIWQFGVNGERITAEQMCIYLSENPAKLYKLYPWKGGTHSRKRCGYRCVESGYRMDDDGGRPAVSM